MNQSVNHAPLFVAECFLAGIVADGCDIPKRLVLGPVKVRGGGNEYEALIPIPDVIGRFEVEVLRVQY